MSFASALSGIGGFLSSGSNLYDTVSGLISNPSVASVGNLGTSLLGVGNSLSGRGGVAAPSSTLLSQSMPQPQAVAPSSASPSLNLSLWLPVGAVVLVLVVVLLCNKK
jgi:hypothetical protein